MLYFAYGSNMSISRLRQRVPSAMRIGISTLHEHDLRFHKKGKDGSGKCDAFETGISEHAVIGCLFKISAAEKAALDKAEGVGFGYEEKEITLIDESGGAVRAMTYYATSVDDSLNPYSWYLQHVVVGATESNLPSGYVSRLVSTENIEDTNHERDTIERAIYS
jgi:hypothetical protein